MKWSFGQGAVRFARAGEGSAGGRGGEGGAEGRVLWSNLLEKRQFGEGVNMPGRASGGFSVRWSAYVALYICVSVASGERGLLWPPNSPAVLPCARSGRQVWEGPGEGSERVPLLKLPGGGRVDGLGLCRRSVVSGQSGADMGEQLLRLRGGSEIGEEGRTLMSCARGPEIGEKDRTLMSYGRALLIGCDEGLFVRDKDPEVRSLCLSGD